MIFDCISSTFRVVHTTFHVIRDQVCDTCLGCCQSNSWDFCSIELCPRGNHKSHDREKSIRNPIITGIDGSSFHHKEDNDNDSVEDFEDIYPYQSSSLKITDSLEECIELWQRAIASYSEFEEYCLEERFKDVAEYLSKIRNDPDSILASHTHGWSHNVIELAKRRKQINLARIQLGLLDNDETIMYRHHDHSRTSHSAPHLLTRLSRENIHNNDTFTNRLSKTWAHRLQDVIPTQGEITVSQITGSSLKYKPKWPDFLTSVTYTVLKRNRLGQRITRIIRLTEYHLLNIKNGNVLSKVYLFRQFRRVLLEDNETVVITLRSGKLLVFISPLAANMAQQIITRVKVRLQLDRMNIDFSSTSLVYSTALTANIIQNISIDAQDASDAMRAFAYELRDRTLRGYITSFKKRHQIEESFNINFNVNFNSNFNESSGHKNDLKLKDLFNEYYYSSSMRGSHIDDREAEGERLGGDSESYMIIERVMRDMIDTIVTVSFDPTTASATIPPRSILAPTPVSPSPPSHLSDDNSFESKDVPSDRLSRSPSIPRNMLSLIEGSKEHQVKCEIQNIIFDVHTPEGNTRHLFIERFASNALEINDYKANLLEVRHFIEGMHGHVLKKMGVELAEILLQLPIDTYTQRHKSRGQNESLLLTPSLPILTESKSSSSRYSRLSLSEQKTINDLSMINEEVLAIVSFVIYTVIEEATFVPLRDEIVALLPSHTQTEEENELQIRRKVFSKRTQKQWSIPDHIISPLNWNSAIYELSTLESNLTPSMMLHALARTAKAIYSEYKLAVVPLLSEDKKASGYLSADDFVPIFIYIFCRSELNHAILNKELMWGLCHPDHLLGEYGYYMTTYESCLEYILHEIPTSEERQQIRQLSSPSSPSHTDGSGGSPAKVTATAPMEDGSWPSNSSPNESLRESQRHLNRFETSPSASAGASSSGRDVAKSSRYRKSHISPQRLKSKSLLRQSFEDS